MTRDARPLEGLDLNLLVTLRSLIQHGSVTRAGERLGQSQSTVSRALASLREAFGDPLLVRVGARMELTETATALREPLERLLADLDWLPHVGGFDPRVSRATFRVAMPDLLALLFAPDVVADVASHAPGAALQILHTSPTTVRELLTDALDLLIAPFAPEGPEFMSRRLSVAPLAWRVLAGAKVELDDPLTVEAWAAVPQVQFVPHGNPDGRGYMDELLEARGLSRHIAVRVAQAGAIGPILARTGFVASLPGVLADRIARKQGLRTHAHPLREDLAGLPIRLSWRRPRTRDASHRWLRNTVASALGSGLEP